jgi:hypothetical protein
MGVFVINYTLDTLNVMACTAIGTKLCGFSKEDITSISLFMGISTLVHRVAIDIFTHFYEKNRDRFTSGLKGNSALIEDTDKKTGKMIFREATFEERLSMPMFVISCLLAYKVTELIFQKISEECLKKALMYLSMVTLLHTYNLRKLF